MYELLTHFQLFVTLMDYSPPGSSVLGILQARILEFAAIPFPRVSSQSRDRTQVSHITGRFFTIWATREAHLRSYPLFQKTILFGTTISHMECWKHHSSLMTRAVIPVWAVSFVRFQRVRSKRTRQRRFPRGESDSWIDQRFVGGGN